jgi:hypothetical protein
MLDGITSDVAELGVEAPPGKCRHELEAGKARARRLEFAAPEKSASDTAARVCRIDKESPNLGGINLRVQTRVISLAACITAEERAALAPSAAPDDVARAIDSDEVSLIIDQGRIDTERTLEGTLDLLVTVVVHAERTNGTSDQIAQLGLISAGRFP